MKIMTRQDYEIAADEMRQYGGSFVKSLAQTYSLADAQNKAIIEAAFNDTFVRYRMSNLCAIR
jgi:hypothetical protein